MLFSKFLWRNLRKKISVDLYGMIQSISFKVILQKEFRNYADLFEWQACTRYVLGNWEQDVFGGRVKVVKKGGHSWARDGHLTETKWSDQDFIFHGWKEL